MPQIFQEPQIKQVTRGQLDTSFQVPEIYSIANTAQRSNDLWDKIKEQERQVDLANEQGTLSNKEAADQKMSLADSFLAMGGDAYRASGLKIKALNLAQTKKEKGGGGGDGTGGTDTLDSAISQLEDTKVELGKMITKGVPTIDFWDAYQNITMQERNIISSSGLSESKKANALALLMGTGDSDGGIASLGKGDNFLYGNSSRQANADEREADIALTNSNRDNQDFVNKLLWTGEPNYKNGEIDKSNPIKWTFRHQDDLDNSKDVLDYKPARIFDEAGTEHLNYFFKTTEVPDTTQPKDDKGNYPMKYVSVIPDETNPLGYKYVTVSKSDYDNWDLTQQRQLFTLGNIPTNQGDVDKAKQQDGLFQKALTGLGNVGTALMGEEYTMKLGNWANARDKAAKDKEVADKAKYAEQASRIPVGIQPGSVLANLPSISNPAQSKMNPTEYANWQAQQQAKGQAVSQAWKSKGVIGLLQYAGREALGGLKNFSNKINNQGGGGGGW